MRTTPTLSPVSRCLRAPLLGELGKHLQFSQPKRGTLLNLLLQNPSGDHQVRRSTR
jgi:hypothetical protein